MKIVCDACSAKYSIADEKVRGKVFKIRCKKCSNIIVVRGSVNDAVEQAAPQYDQKETKVFAYAGSQRADSAAEVSESAVWHLVIEQEQVGPMTIEEVRDRFQRGEVDGEGFAWREGFGDWERLADVEEFAGIVTGSPADDGRLGGLFGAGGGEPYDDGRAAQSDPADLFAARGAGDDPGASDLFSGTGLTASADGGAADSDSLFAGDGGGGMGMAAVSSGGKPVVSSLTAQRNENSVLFSLNNLAALASDAPRSMPLSTPSVSSSSASSSSSMSAAASAAPQSEGSGLIDIRSMAQVYLGESKPHSARPVGSGSVDDLPVFSQSSFESASPVLLPTVQPAVNNRLLIALVGLIGVLVLAAVVLVVIVLKGGSDRAKVAAADTAAAAQKAAASAATPPPPAAATADPPAAGTPPPSAGTTGNTEAPAAAMPPSEPSGDTDRGSGEDEEGSSKSSSSDRDRRDKKGRDKDKDKDRRDRRDKDRERRDRRDESRDREAKVAATPPPPDPTASSGCDEVTCLVEPDKPCCKKYGRRSSSSGSSSRSVDPSLPEQPSRGDVASGVGDVKGSVSACGSRAPGGGKVTVKIKISPSGSVSSASASGGTASLNGCVESAVRRARFPKSQNGVSVNYPFIF